MPKYNLFYNLLICSINTVLAQCGECEKNGECVERIGELFPNPLFYWILYSFSLLYSVLRSMPNKRAALLLLFPVC